MEHFGHFFEFIAALNSAYIVSNHFLESLVSKINNHFSATQTEMGVIATIHENNTNWLISDAEKSAGNAHAQIALTSLQSENEENQKETNKLAEELKDAISKNSISNNFNYLCLFGALYSILILILNGFQYKFDELVYSEMFGLFNVLSIIMLIWIIYERKLFTRQLKPTYTNILIVFPVCLLLVFPGFYYLQKWKPSINCEYDFMWFNILVSILLPTSHFLYYSLKTSLKTKKEALNLKQKSSSLRIKCEDFSKKIKGAEGVIDVMVNNH